MLFDPSALEMVPRPAVQSSIGVMMRSFKNLDCYGTALEHDVHARRLSWVQSNKQMNKSILNAVKLP